MDNFDLRKFLAEDKLQGNSGEVLVDKVEPRWIIANPSNINMKGIGGGPNNTITYYKRKESAQKELDDKIQYSKTLPSDNEEYIKEVEAAEVIEVEMQVKITVK